MNEKQKTYEIVMQNICNLLKGQKLQQKDLCEALNLKKKSFTEWKSGRSTSYMKKLPEIASYLGVTTEYLLGNEKEKTPTNVGEGEQELFDLWNNVPVEKREAFIKLFKALLDTL